MTYIIVTVAYLVFLTSIIIYKSRSVKTQDDFVVAGRGVPVYLLVGTLVCTWIGSGSLFGTAGLTFRSGFSELWFSMGAWIGIIVIYFIAARIRAISKYTLTDLLETRYNKAARLLGTITIIVAYLVIAGYQFKGGGRFINILTEGSVSPETGTMITCVLIISFTALAGMVSIVSIDIFNGVIMLLAVIVAVPLAINSHGGWGEVVNTIKETRPDYLSLTEGHSFTWALGVILPTLMLLLSESSIYQKFSSAKDARSAKKAVVGMLSGVVVIELLMCTLAVVGFAIYAHDSRFFLSDGSVNRAMSEEIILRIGYEQLPAYAGSLIFAAGVAIILSTGNTFLMVSSTNVTRDLLQPIFGKVVEEKFLMIQRVAIVALGILAFVLVSQFETILEMAFISYTMIGASIAPVLMASFFWKRVTPAGGVASIIGGMIVPVINKVLESTEGSFWIFPMDTDYIAIPALAASLILLVGVSLMTKPSPESKWKPFFS
ncbi:sodium:solute symporter family protein [Fulvivirga sp. 29W222]|uniref:Sodium:solute symporter family protein n=1 Tax=Fulvivirga marina TaxID=2494733 RepID=A0A937G1X1_9BACT|nr:sodium:solute symporter family protein [Fulvivirga marina]MBL6446966.1 sodium:solute symporter family protein [Fulvivirga marina]